MRPQSPFKRIFLDATKIFGNETRKTLSFFHFKITLDFYAITTKKEKIEDTYIDQQPSWSKKTHSRKTCFESKKK
jgi:hypothetical protein